MTLWQEYEKRKAAIRDLPPEEYDEAMRKIVKDLGV